MDSIFIRDIDWNNCYFNPGCALATYKPASADRLLHLLRRHFGPVRPHNLCCHHDPQVPEGAVIINNCAGCDRRFRSEYPGVRTISLWELLDTVEDLPLPDYGGLAVSVQDPCSYRPKPQVHRAVRSLLRKMNLEVIDAALSGTRSVCCGDNFYTHLPKEAVVEQQKKRAAQMPCQDVVVYCVSCMKSMAVGGKTPRYLVDLLFGEPSLPGETDLDRFHGALNCYIDAH